MTGHKLWHPHASIAYASRPILLTNNVHLSFEGWGKGGSGGGRRNCQYLPAFLEIYPLNQDISTYLMPTVPSLQVGYK